MNKSVEISAPGKLMLFGEHAVIYNRPCIVTAVDQRIRVYAELAENGVFRVAAPEVGVKEYVETIGGRATSEVPKGARFTITALRNFFKHYGVLSGVAIRTKSEFSSEYGFGSSSAVTVAVIKAVAELFSIEMSSKELFELSYKTVLDVQGTGSGFDVAAAIWGGTIYFKPGTLEIAPLNVKDLCLTVGYTGSKADTQTLVRQVADFHSRYGSLAERLFDTMAEIVELARISLAEMNIEKVGHLMNVNQGLLESLGVNTLQLSNLVYAARQAGAFGAKLSGAGGGDCMIALSAKQHEALVAESIENAGGTVIKVQIGAPGAHRERDSDPG